MDNLEESLPGQMKHMEKAETIKKSVLFLCTHNSARSQMAEGLLKEIYGDRFDVYSAGTEPSRVNPYAIRVMKELGIDISEHSSKHMDDFDLREFDYIVTVCDSTREACPVAAGGHKNIHKGFSDPSRFRGKDEEILAGFRTIRDQIRIWIEEEFSQD